MTIVRSARRVTQFADGVRHRVTRARTHRTDRWTWGRKRVEQVLHTSGRRRLAPRHHLSPEPRATTMRLSLRLDVHPPPGARRDGLRLATRWDRTTVAAATPTVRPMPTVLIRQATRPASSARAPVYAVDGPTPIPTVARGSVPAPRRVGGPAAVPQVLRRAVVAAPAASTQPGRLDHRADIGTPLSVRWTGEGPGAARSAADRSAALTADDVPGVVDRVVRELDRRVTAARERKGWAG